MKNLLPIFILTTFVCTSCASGEIAVQPEIIPTQIQAAKSKPQKNSLTNTISLQEGQILRVLKTSNSYVITMTSESMTGSDFGKPITSLIVINKSPLKVDITQGKNKIENYNRLGLVGLIDSLEYSTTPSATAFDINSFKEALNFLKSVKTK